ncbi:MAG: TerB family tellurite resistance protein [Myxococcales bacterium]|nr:TerB family tellurite resistance protein [Myxococcales bacterium]
MSSMTGKDAALVEAIAAAYALVSAVDSDIDEQAYRRLRQWAKDRGMTPEEQATLEQRCRDFSQGLLTYSGPNRAVALERVAALRGHSQSVWVLDAARVAVVANERVTPEEEMTLQRVAESLGLDPLEA